MFPRPRVCLSLLIVISVTLFVTPVGAATRTLGCSNPKVMKTDGTTPGYEGTLSFPPYVVQQDVWTQQGQQTMYVCNEHDWNAIAKQSGAPATGVKTYPDSQKTYTDWQHCSSQPPLSSFSKLTGAYGEVSPNAGSYDWAWDIFLNNFCGKPLTEVMVLNQWRNVDYPASQSVTIDHVPYLYYHSGTIIQFRRVHQNSSDTVNLLRVLHWCQRHGLVTSTDTMQFVAYGVEVLTTRGKNVPFSLNRFSVTDG
jgi:hypothetical protein